MTEIRIPYGKAGWPFDLAAGIVVPGDDDAVLPVALTLDTAAVDPFVPPALAPDPNAVPAVANSVGSNGAADMNVPAASATYDVTGAGIRIGILSTSFDAQGTADLQTEEKNGDLPPAASIDILSDYTGAGASDEGRAMAEVVHAAAPGAAIDFATAYSTDAQFAAGILSLAAAGCNIIVDDVTYFDEPFFENSNVIQQAVEAVIAEGVSYFTAASNEGVNYYQATVDILSSATLLPDGTQVLGMEDFGATAAAHSGSDTLQDISMLSGVTLDFDLQWTQPFRTDGTSNVIGPGSAYSLTLYLFNGTTLAASATSDVTGGDPVQVMQFDPPAAGTYQLAIALTDGTVPSGDTLKYIVYESYTTAGSQMTIEDSNAGQGSGDIIGHEAVGGVNTVGAVAAGTPTTPEAFSSYGPGTLDSYSATGVLTGTTVENKPNFVAPDGISTSVGGFSSFYGTSAAAPDAAAVAALMLQANPNLTPAQVTAALQATATAVGGSVNQVGAGLVNAAAAVKSVNGDVWASDSGTWDTGADWSAATAPGTGEPATLSNDFGTLTPSYTVTVAGTDAVADTLTVGNATSAAAMPNVVLAIAAGKRLTVATGATVTQHGTLTVAGTGTLTVGGLAELTDATAVLTLADNAVMTAAVFEIGTGSLAIGSGARLTASGSIDLEIEVVDNTGTSYTAIAYGLATGGGTITVNSGGKLAVTGAGGVLLGGVLTVQAGATLNDANSGGVGFLVLGGTLSDAGTVTTPAELLVNTAASATVTAGGTLSAPAIDVEGTGAALIVAGRATDAGALTGATTGTVTIKAAGTLAIGGAMSGPGIDLAAGGRLVLNSLDAATLTTGMTSVITLTGTTLAEIDLPGVAYHGGRDTLDQQGSGTLGIVSGATTLANLAFPADANYHFIQTNDGGGGLLLGVACYCRGTQIATPAGEVPIEALRIGDLVLTAANAARPIRWIGRRSYGRSHITTQRHLQPIRIRAGALGADAAGPVPRRDLRVSPEHALLLPEEAPPGAVLVPAQLLVNGASIVRETDRAGVDYFHLELDDHDAVLAEGAPAETFVDRNSRVLFDNAAEFIGMYPDAAAQPARPFCAPRIEVGPVLVRVLHRLHGFAGIVHGPLGDPTGGPAGGHVDRADREMVAGWAYDHANPDCPVLLEIVLDGAIVGTALADRYRTDMAALKFAGGYCAFRWNFPAPLDPARRHIVAVRRAADGACLRSSPALIDRIERPAVVLDGLRSAPAKLRRELADFLGGEIERLRQRAAGLCPPSR